MQRVHQGSPCRSHVAQISAEIKCEQGLCVWVEHCSDTSGRGQDLRTNILQGLRSGFADAPCRAASSLSPAPPTLPSRQCQPALNRNRAQSRRAQWCWSCRCLHRKSSCGAQRRKHKLPMHVQHPAGSASSNDGDVDQSLLQWRPTGKCMTSRFRQLELKVNSTTPKSTCYLDEGALLLELVVHGQAAQLRVDQLAAATPGGEAVCASETRLGVTS